MDATTTPATKVATVKLLIGGKFVESKTTEWRDIVNPATQEVLARVPFATQAEVDAAVASAKEAFKTWRKTPIGARARIFLKYQQLIRENMAELAAILTAEQGKTLPDAEGDVFRGLEVVEHAAAIGNLQLGELANNVANGVDTYTLLQPLGVCAGITPFNFPAMIPLWMFPMAIATRQHLRAEALRAGPDGHDAPVRTRARSRHSARRAQRRARRRGGGQRDLRPQGHQGDLLRRLDQGRHARLQPRHARRQARAMHDGREEPRHRACPTPTRSRRSTRWPAPASARRASAAWRCRSRCWWARRSKWVPDLVAKAKTLKIGAGTEKGVDVGPLVSCAAYDRVNGLIERGVAEGATLALDGRKPTVPGYEKGNFVGPTIFAGVKPGMTHLRPGDLRPRAVPGQRRHASTRRSS